MEKEKVEQFKQQLLEELTTVEDELRELGVKNPTTGEWEATAPEMDVMSPLADPNESADKLEEYDENRAEIEEIQTHWRDIKSALEKIENNEYGMCEECGAEIEEDRLEAYPAARTCKAHM